MLRIHDQSRLPLIPSTLRWDETVFRHHE